MNLETRHLYRHDSSESDGPIELSSLRAPRGAQLGKVSPSSTNQCANENDCSVWRDLQAISELSHMSRAMFILEIMTGSPPTQS